MVPAPLFIHSPPDSGSSAESRSSLPLPAGCAFGPAHARPAVACPTPRGKGLVIWHLFVRVFVCSDLLSICFVPATVLGTGDKKKVEGPP